MWLSKCSIIFFTLQFETREADKIMHIIQKQWFSFSTESESSLTYELKYIQLCLCLHLLAVDLLWIMMKWRIHWQITLEWYVFTSRVQDCTILSYNLQKINTYKRGSHNSPLIPDERWSCRFNSSFLTFLWSSRWELESDASKQPTAQTGWFPTAVYHELRDRIKSSLQN